ncbi:MAG: phosphotransacetylase [Gammaproteobacteria bacterium]|nr:phosphotransacetylase [Gammaproteobacteria bacterium]
MVSDLDDLIKLAPGKQHIVVLAEAADERMIRAARILAEQEIASPILTGDEEKIRSIANSVSISLDDIDVVNPASDTQDMNRYIALCTNGPRPLKPAIAQRLMRKTLMYSAMMVQSGDAHAMIAGSSVPTARVIEAGMMIIGTEESVATTSSYFLMTLSGSDSAESRYLIFADCAVNVNPTAEQLADIACSTALNAKLLLTDDPRIAFLSFSSKGSARHKMVSKVASAVDLTRERLPDMLIDGEFQFDTAFDERTATLKLKEPSPVAGQANVFIFPDLNAGNIGYKLTQYLAGAQAIGPILQGFAKPISDLSRGATVYDIVKATVVLLATIE